MNIKYCLNDSTQYDIALARRLFQKNKIIIRLKTLSGIVTRVLEKYSTEVNV